MARAGFFAAFLAGLLLAGCTTGAGSIGFASPSVLPGGLAEGDLGSGLTDRDRKLAAEAEYSALEHGSTGAPVAWQNKRSGHRGEVVPGAAYKVNNSDCRDYTHTITGDGPPTSGRGTACRHADGRWKPVS